MIVIILLYQIFDDNPLSERPGGAEDPPDLFDGGVQGVLRLPVSHSNETIKI
jgi:hypothetical protein